eukprot:287003-Amorphochlora_amoeboformis.AAC.1
MKRSPAQAVRSVTIVTMKTTMLKSIEDKYTQIIVNRDILLSGPPDIATCCIETVLYAVQHPTVMRKS